MTDLRCTAETEAFEERYTCDLRQGHTGLHRCRHTVMQINAFGETRDVYWSLAWENENGAPPPTERTEDEIWLTNLPNPSSKSDDPDERWLATNYGGHVNRWAWQRIQELSDELDRAYTHAGG